jgi:outer membrane protein OmpA-like peptidoglycan-associated protein
MDLYLTRKQGNGWSQPQPMSFINTDINDEFVSIPAHGEIVYYTDKFKEQFHLFEAVLPEALRPDKVMMLSGLVSGIAPEQAQIFIHDATDATPITIGNVRTTGNFFALLPSGSMSDFSIFPKQSGYSFYSRLYDLRHTTRSGWEKPEITLQPLTPGSEHHLSAIRFEPYSAALSATSALELRRIARLMQMNPQASFEIAAYIDQVYTDSLQHGDFTEAVHDTVYVEIMNEPTQAINQYTLPSDSTVGNDGNTLAQQDSLMLQGYRPLDPEDAERLIFYKVNTTYHNDRTQAQAQAIVDRLVADGAPPHRLRAVGYSDRFTKDRAEEERSYWVMLRVLE